MSGMANRTNTARAGGELANRINAVRVDDELLTSHNPVRPIRFLWVIGESIKVAAIPRWLALRATELLLPEEEEYSVLAQSCVRN